MRTAGLISLLTLCACTQPRGDGSTDGGLGVCVSAPFEALDFGEVRGSGPTAKRLITLTNQTSLAFTLDITAPQAPFSLLDEGANPLPTQLGIGNHSTRTMTVVFAPNDQGLSHVGTLQVAVNGMPMVRGGCQPVVITLSGRSKGELFVEPLDFGFVPIGVAKTLDLVIHNSTTQDVDFDAISPQLEPPFTTTKTTSFTVPAHGAMLVPITAHPTQGIASRQTQLTTSLGIVAAPISVVAGMPVAQLDRTLLEIPEADFQPFSSPRAVTTREVHLRNLGTGGAPEADLGAVFPFITFETLDGGPTMGEVQLTSDHFTAPLSAGQSSTLQVRVVPLQVGPLEQRVTLFTNDPEHPRLTLTVKTNAVTLPACGLEVTPPLSTAVGGTNSPVILDGGVGTLEFHNVGAERCVIDDPRIIADGGASWVLDGGFEQFSIAQGATHTFEIGVTGPMGGEAELRFTVFGPGFGELVIPLQR